MSIGSNFILYLFKNKIIFNVVKYVATKKGKTANFSPSSETLKEPCLQNKQMKVGVGIYKRDKNVADPNFKSLESEHRFKRPANSYKM
jgi:hypothetical protein